MWSNTEYSGSPPPPKYEHNKQIMSIIFILLYTIGKTYRWKFTVFFFQKESYIRKQQYFWYSLVIILPRCGCWIQWPLKALHTHSMETLYGKKNRVNFIHWKTLMYNNIRWVYFLCLSEIFPNCLYSLRNACYFDRFHLETSQNQLCRSPLGLVRLNSFVDKP